MQLFFFYMQLLNSIFIKYDAKYYCDLTNMFWNYIRVLWNSCLVKFCEIRSTNVRVLCRVSNRTWTRTLNPNEPFHFGEPEPNLNQQNFTSVNLNQTWTLKIVLKWTQTEPEPLTKVRIYFSISGCRWRWYTHNKSSGDHRQDPQFLLFFSGRNE